jgi:phenylpropionate dioxygenase-like ring-hydroxylating dioxygenase large terminal subunit
VCPYHGWQYRADGICTAIPQLADPTRVPSKARIDAYTCREALGLIWVAMDAPRYELLRESRRHRSGAGFAASISQSR